MYNTKIKLISLYETELIWGPGLLSLVTNWCYRTSVVYHVHLEFRDGVALELFLIRFNPFPIEQNNLNKILF